MLDQLTTAVSQRTGLPPEKAQAAVEAVISQLKSRLPAPIAAHLDALLSGASSDASGGMLGDLESKATDMLGGMFK